METPAATPAPLVALTIKVGEKDIDLSKLKPYTLADRIALQKLGVVNEKMDGDPTMEAKFVLYALQKLDPTITWEEVLNIPYGNAIATTIEYMKRGTAIDRPTSTPSTPSDSGTAGVQKT